MQTDSVKVLFKLAYTLDYIEKERINSIKNNRNIKSKPKIALKWSLLDENNEKISEKDFSGKFVLYSFHKSDFGKAKNRKMLRIEQILSLTNLRKFSLKNLQMISVSVKSEKESNKNLIEKDKINESKIVKVFGLIGQINEVEKAFDTFYNGKESLYDCIFLIDKNGDFVKVFDSSITVNECIHQIKLTVMSV